MTTSTKARSSTSSRRSDTRPPELKQFLRFCSELKVDLRPFKLYPEQIEIVEPYFDGVRETVVILSKKNGKSTLIAALVIYHLLVTPNADCIVVAAARDQAQIILDQARKFIRGHPDLRRYVRVMQRRIEMVDGSGRARVLASDEDTADGQLPTLAVVDELHRHRTMGLYTTLRLAINTTGGQMVTISTAGAAGDSPLGQKRTRAMQTKGFVRDSVKRRSTLRVKDNSFAFLEWSLNIEDDPEDMKLVKLVNPAPWKTIKMLREERAAVSIGVWLRFACGIWTAGDEPAILPADWDRLEVDIGGIEDGEPVVIVPSVGHNAAIAIAASRSEGRVAIRAEVLEPEDGTSILVRTEDRLAELCERYVVDGIYHPLGSFVRSPDILAPRVNAPLIVAAQSPAALTAASGTFNRLLRSGRLMHDGDPILRSHALSATLKTSETGERYEITDRSRALIAAVFATHYASVEPLEPYIGLPSEVG